MGFTVEQDCPQCGAPVELDETDRLIECPYCEVKHFLFFSKYLRFILPHKAPNQELIYAPYLRFRGSVFYCIGLDVGYRIVDITRLGVAIKNLPGSLGVRPQALKMRFATPDTEGKFLKFSLNASDIIEGAGRLSSMASSGKLYHRAFIGETISLIYFPMYIKGKRLFDAIVNRPISNDFFEEENLGSLIKNNPQWKIKFLPTLCPYCGWNMDGESDSVVLACKNCKKFWAPSGNRFIEVQCLYVPGDDSSSVYLPFWKINVSSSGLEMNSFADFIRLTKQPKIIREAWEKENMSFWTPAFKIRPKIFLRLSRQLTISQEPGSLKEGFHGTRDYPVTLPLVESAQSMKLVLADSAEIKGDVIPKLQVTSFDMKRSTLVYLPFKDNGREMIQEQTGTSIDKNTMEFGRKL
jgi:hypothetical protein